MVELPVAKDSRPQAVLRLALVASLALVAARLCPAVDIRVGPGVVGKTPAVVGYNSGHLMPGSNTADWWRYSGVNGARVWATPSVVEGSDDMPPWGDGVNSQASFLARRDALRGDPLNTSYVNWPHFESRYENNPTSGNRLLLDHAFGTLHEMGVASLAVIGLSVARHPFAERDTAAGWADRWEYWQHFYAQAFHLARHFDVERFHMYNEPDHSSNANITQAQYLERLQFASDAVQAAVADVNSLFGKALTPQMQAPVTAGGSNKFTPTPGGDPRDDVTGWGQLVVENRHVDFLGQTDANFNLFHTYAYQQYNRTGPAFGDDLATIKNLVNQASGGEEIRFAVTEFNVHTAGVFASMSETLDTPSKSSRFGSILANLANNQPDELYVFKFSQTDNQPDGSIKKNGVHYVDNDTAPYNVGGVTKGGEVVRLFAKGFAGANDLLAVPAATGAGAGDLQLAAAFAPQKNHYYLFSANESTAPRDLRIDVSRWGIQAGVRVIVEQVSADRHGEVSHILTVPQNGVLNLTQADESVVLLSIPKSAAAHHVTLTATDDAMVKAGSNAGSSYGGSPNLFVKNEPTNPAARNVSFIKFHTGSILTSEVEQAVLQVWGENTGSAAQVIAHVYGLFDDDWNEATINWNNAPNLAPSLGLANDISHNFVQDVGGTAQFVGHLTGTGTPRSLSLDVTDFVRDHPDSEVTFLIAREVRFDGEDVDDALASLRLASKERGTDPGPQLLLSLSRFALTGDYDGSGVVEAADFDLWKASFLSTTDLAADGNRDGIIDAADYTVWRDALGSTLHSAAEGLAVDASATGRVALPEPTSLLLLLAGFAGVARYAPLRCR